MNEVKHFTKAPEIQHFAEVKVSQFDNAYGVTWAEVVKNYLKTAYSGENAQAEVKAFGKTYKVLRRTEVTAFYDKDGNTLFDVTNERLADEYDWLTRNPVSEAEETEDKEVVEAIEQLKEHEENTQKSSVYIGVVGAVTKLQEELKKAKEKKFAEPIIEFLIGRCKESESLAISICQDHKTWPKCYDYIFEKARKSAKGARQAAIPSDTVFEWAEDYYRKDDKAEEEAKAKKEAEKKAKEKARQEKLAAEKKQAQKEAKEIKTSTSKNKQEKKEEPPKKKKKDKNMDGQMDLFSLMGN